ncbi:WLM-domain-containing protein [Canariomyces notabilis]|uniref:WLM-domain-containing protein n=1 Tax=Canariomyces notabilis TaxID=2074819 RepID=A0AAN6YR75_9PEZI|nr:WLM-domain-containing protein [Canariomyces arenarius]
MYPSRADLLGLNVDRGREIKVRLRQHWDRSQFLPFEEILDTMLHELVHIVHGPHDDKFNALWDQLRDEMEGLMMKGYTGDGFLSQGRRLGGRSIPYDEIRRLARAEAERNKPKPSQGYGGHRLGGSRPPPGQDIRNVILESIERRNRAEKGCGSQNRSEREIQEISESWKQNGFRTKAEEDEANEAAIAQALWELVQEDEKRKYGSSYIPPSAQNPFGNGGGAFLGYDNAGYGTGVTGSRAAYPAMPTTTRPPPPTRPKSPVKNYWACSLCTLHNPLHAEKCDACGVSAPRGPSRFGPS